MVRNGGVRVPPTNQSSISPGRAFTGFSLSLLNLPTALLQPSLFAFSDILIVGLSDRGEIGRGVPGAEMHLHMNTVPLLQRRTTSALRQNDQCTIPPADPSILPPPPLAMHPSLNQSPVQAPLQCRRSNLVSSWKEEWSSTMEGNKVY